MLPVIEASPGDVNLSPGFAPVTAVGVTDRIPANLRLITGPNFSTIAVFEIVGKLSYGPVTWNSEEPV